METSTDCDLPILKDFRMGAKPAKSKLKKDQKIVPLGERKEYRMNLGVIGYDFPLVLQTSHARFYGVGKSTLQLSWFGHLHLGRTDYVKEKHEVIANGCVNSLRVRWSGDLCR